MSLTNIFTYSTEVHLHVNKPETGTHTTWAQTALQQWAHSSFVFPTILSVKVDLHLPLLRPQQGLSHLGDRQSLGVRSVQEVTCAWLLHDLSPWVATHVAEAIVAEDDGAVLHSCVGDDKLATCGWREKSLWSTVSSNPYLYLHCNNIQKPAERQHLSHTSLTFKIKCKWEKNPYKKAEAIKTKNIAFINTTPKIKVTVKYGEKYGERLRRLRLALCNHISADLRVCVCGFACMFVTGAKILHPSCNLNSSVFPRSPGVSLLQTTYCRWSSLAPWPLLNVKVWC